MKFQDSTISLVFYHKQLYIISLFFVSSVYIYIYIFREREREIVFFWLHFEQIQGYASRCLLGSLCPLVCGAAEWFSHSGDVHDLHHAELCSRATAEILSFVACLSPPSCNQK